MKRGALLRFARLAVEVARRRMPDYGSKFAPQRFTHPSLRACLGLKEAWQLDARRALRPWEPAPRRGGRRWASAGWACPSPLWGFSRPQGPPRRLEQGLPEPLRRFQRVPGEADRTIAGDATGFSRDRARRDARQRAGKGQPAQTWLKGSLAIWTAPLLLWAQVADGGPKHV